MDGIVRQWETIQRELKTSSCFVPMEDVLTLGAGWRRRTRAHCRGTEKPAKLLVSPGAKVIRTGILRGLKYMAIFSITRLMNLRTRGKLTKSLKASVSKRETNCSL